MIKKFELPKFNLKPNLRSHTKPFFDEWTNQDFFDEFLKIQMKQSTLSKSQRQKIINYVKRIKSKDE